MASDQHDILCIKYKAKAPMIYQENLVILKQVIEENHTPHEYTYLGDVSHLTLHAAGPPGEQFGLGERQLEPGPTLLLNLGRVR